MLGCSYDMKSKSAEEFINHNEIEDTLRYADEHSSDGALIRSILNKARRSVAPKTDHEATLSHREASVLLACGDPSAIAEIKELASEIKQAHYGNRVVLFAPLYLSNYCVNGCVYCPYHAQGKSTPRRKLTQAQIHDEVVALQSMGHKRIAVEAGEDPINNPIEYILESLDTIYAARHRNGSIRRANMNIAATTVEDYKRLADASIGTYILFQETYCKESYEKLHPFGPKSDYAWHTEAHDRAMQGGIGDVGLGVLFGLENYRYELCGLLMHAEHLEAAYGIGPHTISVPRIRRAAGIDPSSFSGGLPDDVFEKIIAILRIAVPYTGLIVSTREDELMRRRVLDLGVSQISGGSRTSVGGYSLEAAAHDITGTEQFDVSDGRTLDEVIAWLIEAGHVPSFCTACYRAGRTGDRFMELCKSGEMSNYCHPNAPLTLCEYLVDYATPRTRERGFGLIEYELSSIKDERVRLACIQSLSSIVSSQARDFRF